jgi:hypothetical protein
MFSRRGIRRPIRYEDMPPSVLPTVATISAGQYWCGVEPTTAARTNSDPPGNKVAARKLLANNAHKPDDSLINDIVACAPGSLPTRHTGLTLHKRFPDNSALVIAVIPASGRVSAVTVPGVTSQPFMQRLLYTLVRKAGHEIRN